MRIVSLLPSATEIVRALGLEDQLVGVTHECDYPASVKLLPKVTRTLIPSDARSIEIDELVREQLRTNRTLYSLDLPVLERLRPDLIVTQAPCDVCAVAEDEVRDAACSLPGQPRVINLEPQTLAEVLSCMGKLALACDVEHAAEEVVAGLKTRVKAVSARTNQLRHRPRVALLEWLDPPFSCGHWSPELVRLAGGDEVLGIEGQPSRTLSWDDVRAARPEMVFIACCGFNAERTMRDLPALRATPEWRNSPAARSGRIYVTNGSDYFSRPGPRLVDSLEILAHALHPRVHPLPGGLPRAIRIADAGATPVSA